MSEILQVIKDGIIATSIIEWIAFITGILYVILAAKKNIWCWLFAIISSSLWLYLCYFANLYLETFLQLFYVIMGFAGWYFWNKSKNEDVPIIKWRIDFHFMNIGISAVLCLVLGFYFDHETAQAYPYLDAFTTVFSLAATYMVTQKVLENWLYWIVVNIASIFLYSAKGLYLAGLQAFILMILAIVGFVQWKKKFELQKNRRR